MRQQNIARYCMFHRESDNTDSCLLDFMETKCDALKCLRTVGQTCSHNEEDQNLFGLRCGANLRCGCDKKCSGCMTVNGKKICHDDSQFCMRSFGKRGGGRGMIEMQDEFDYPVENRILRVID